jgi:hypothetical protein
MANERGLSAERRWKVSRGVSGNEIMALPASTIAMFRRGLMNEDTVVVSFVRESFAIPVGDV